MAAADSTAFRALSDVVLAIAAEHEVEPVLQRLVDSARELAGAKYAALGIPDGEGAFASFITSGMSDELIEAMGPLPRTHGMLGAMLESAEPHLTDDITQDPRFRGWWPRAHPLMRSFLGVPIVTRGEVLGAVYLTEKVDGSMFSSADQKLIELLAAHAAIAIENARLYQRSRELSIIEERNRLARELHDSVTQRLFGVKLAAESAATLLERDPSKAAVELARVSELARGAMEELRAVVFELRPGSLERRGPGDRAAQARRGAAAGVRGEDRAAASATSRGSPPARRPRCCGSPRRRSATRCATRRPSGSRSSSAATTSGCS